MTNSKNSWCSLQAFKTAADIIQNNTFYLFTLDFVQACVFFKLGFPFPVFFKIIPRLQTHSDVKPKNMTLRLKPDTFSKGWHTIV